MTKEAKDSTEDDLLAQYGFGDLPSVFSMRDGNNVIQERSACYRCAADGFYGQGKHGTWYEEGSIIVMDVVPNYHTEPLNRAAGLRWAKWQSSLPHHKAAFGMEDMAEASQILAKNPDVQKLDPITYQAALIKLCEQLKLKRGGLTVPEMGAHNFAPSSGGNSPPILGAKQSDMGQRGPGGLHGDGPRGPGGGVRRAAAPAPASAGNALGGPAPV